MAQILSKNDAPVKGVLCGLVDEKLNCVTRWYFGEHSGTCLVDVEVFKGYSTISDVVKAPVKKGEAAAVAAPVNMAAITDAAKSAAKTEANNATKALEEELTKVSKRVTDLDAAVKKVPEDAAAALNTTVVTMQNNIASASTRIADLNSEMATVRQLALKVGTTTSCDDSSRVSVNQDFSSYTLVGLNGPTEKKQIKQIIGGVFGQEVTIQFQVNYQLVHSNTLRLQNGKSIESGLDANTFIKFKCIDATKQIWAFLGSSKQL